MKKKIHIPADVHLLIALARRLAAAAGYSLGELKSSNSTQESDNKNDFIALWFSHQEGEKEIRRVNAGLVRVKGEYPRRVYMNIAFLVPFGEGEQWFTASDQLYEEAGLLPPWKYGGASLIIAWWDGYEGGYVDCAVGESAGVENSRKMFEYYPLLRGDRQRAIKESEAFIDRLEKEQKRIDDARQEQRWQNFQPQFSDCHQP